MFHGIVGEMDVENGDPIVGSLSAREWRKKLNQESLKDIEVANETDEDAYPAADLCYKHGG